MTPLASQYSIAKAAELGQDGCIIMPVYTNELQQRHDKVSDILWLSELGKMLRPVGIEEGKALLR